VEKIEEAFCICGHTIKADVLMRMRFKPWIKISKTKKNTLNINNKRDLVFIHTTHTHTYIYVKTNS